jgi:hypothetical protein
VGGNGGFFISKVVGANESFSPPSVKSEFPHRNSSNAEKLQRMAILPQERQQQKINEPGQNHGGAGRSPLAEARKREKVANKFAVKRCFVADIGTRLHSPALWRKLVKINKTLYPSPLY